MSVEKVMTFRSGKFVFSDVFASDQVQPLEIELHLLFESLRELPILPDQAKSFEERLIHRSIFSTAALEGNPLREHEVSEIISGNNKSAIESKDIEIYNLAQAYQFIEAVSREENFIINENLITELHAIITQNLHYEDCVPGRYRNHIVKVGDKAHGGVTPPPKCLADIQNLMETFVNWFQHIEASELLPVYKAAIAHYHLAKIHPFADGNGRVARLVESAILKKYGIKYLPEMLSNYYYREIDNYYRAFSLCRKNKRNDISAFILFVLQGSIQSLKEVKKYINSHLRTTALGEYFQNLYKSKLLTKRQHELLNLLLTLSPDFTITVQSIQRELPFRTLYVKVTDRTARRDIAKLNAMKLLKESDGMFMLDREILNAL